MKSIQRFSGRFENAFRADVRRAIACSVAAGDDWLVPVKPIEEGMNETDFEEEELFAPLPFFLKRAICTQAGTQMACAFTGIEKLSGDGEDETVVSLRSSARAVQEEFCKWNKARAPTPKVITSGSLSRKLG